MNPTFLFTWKGTRADADEKSHCHDYPQIISKEDFDAVQEIKAKNTKCRKK